MSTVLATLSATAMRLGQPSYVDVSARLGDIVLGVPAAHYENWCSGLDAQQHQWEEMASPEGRDASKESKYATKTISPNHWTFTLRSIP